MSDLYENDPSEWLGECSHRAENTRVEPDTGEIWCMACGEQLDSSTPAGKEALGFHLPDNKHWMI